MFTDRVTIKLQAGRGGNGVVAWTRAKFIPKGGPCGGNGGKGGSVFIQTTNDLFSLDHFRNIHLIKASNGGEGGANCRTGRNGQDKIIRVPCGTLVRDAKSGDLIADLTENNTTMELCQGGKGGFGNDRFKSPTNRTPRKCTPGREGESLEIELELKLIADIGFVGLPNAGKSTLMSALTPNQVKIGDYPFTTLKPNLSYVEYDDYSRVYLADIPGIIKDAHEGRGLGLEFLRHIERSHVLVYVIDVNQTPEDDFELLRHELREYDPALLERPSIICLNKCDLLEDESVVDDFKAKFQSESIQIHAISALEKQALPALLSTMKELAQAVVVRY